MKKKSEAKQEEKVMTYCGPDIKGVVKSFTSFRAIPSELVRASEECPAINKLIVPASEIAETRKQLRISGSAAQIFFNKITDFYKKG